MTFTWSSTDLSTALSQVRQTIGDTDTNRPLLTDEQINWRLGQYSQSVAPAAIRCVQDIIGALTRDIDRSNVGMSASRSQKIANYKDLLEQLKSENAALAEMYVGGTSVSEKETINDNSDYEQAAIKRRWGRNPG